jgi:hypothetical protein
MDIALILESMRTAKLARTASIRTRVLWKNSVGRNVSDLRFCRLALVSSHASLTAPLEVGGKLHFSELKAGS